MACLSISILKDCMTMMKETRKLTVGILFHNGVDDNPVSGKDA